MFTSIVIPKINEHVSNEQLKRVTELIEKNPNLFNSTVLLKQSRSVSYMSFLLKELAEYITAKTSGVYINDLKGMFKEKSRLEDLLSKL